MRPCDICGNDLAPGVQVCPFCGSRQEPGGNPVNRPFRCKVVNLERGMPVVEDAMARLEAFISEARERGITVLTVIHGYGSSGRGGKIRAECRKILEYKCSRGEVSDVVPGEAFCRRNGQTRSLLKRFPKLAADHNLDRGNQGITLVIL